MANSKISALTSATTPLAGTETLPIVQSSATTKVTVANLTAGRAVSALSVTLSSLTSGRVPYATTSGLLTDSANLQFSGSNLGVGYTPNTWYTTFNAIQFGGYGSSVFGRSENNSSAIASNAYVNASGNFTYINTNYASYYQQLNGQHQWFTANSGTGGTSITFSTVLTLDVGGNLIPGVAGKGVNFTSNTPAAGMTSQLLNWYEEGTWTPADASGAGLTFTSVTAKYTRIGRQVTATAVLTFPTTASAVQSQISGLPFAASNMGQFLGIRTGVVGGISGLVSAGGTTIVLYTQTGGSVTNATNSTATIYLTGTYFV